MSKEINLTEKQQVIQITDYYAHEILAPQSWEKALLSDVCQIVGGSQPPKECFINEPRDGYIRLIQIRDYKTDKFATYIPIELAKRFCNKEDIMIGRYGPPIFQILRGLEGAYNVALMKAIPHAQLIYKEFLYYFLQTPNIFNYVAAASLRTAGQDGVRKEHLDNYPLFIPPFNEQKRIVAKIEELNDRTQKTKEALDSIPQLCDRFRQSVLAAAFRGDLTADWREQNLELAPNSTKDFPNIPFVPPIVIGEAETPTPFGWAWVSLIDVAILESGHTPRKSVPEYWEDGDVPWICLQDIRAADGKIIDETLFKPTMLGIQNSSARLLPEGTVCFSRDISVGFVTIMGRSMATTQHFANWICDSRLFNQYLMYAFIASRSSLIQSGEGTTVRTIYMPALKKMQILMPSIAEQKEIVFKIQSIFAAIDNIEKQYQQAKAQLSKLNQSILSKAFRGELVPQDPDDEPASVLLERIRAEREKLNNSKPKSDRTSKRKRKTVEGQGVLPGFE